MMWTGAFAVSFVVQSVFQARFASLTLWGLAPGWQNEIAIWNVGMILVITRQLSSEDKAAAIVPGLTVLSLLFSANHASALHLSRDLPMREIAGNVAGCAGNAVAAVLGLLYLVVRRTR